MKSKLIFFILFLSVFLFLLYLYIPFTKKGDLAAINFIPDKIDFADKLEYERELTQVLNTRYRKQQEILSKETVFYNFQFSNLLNESNITFTNKVIPEVTQNFQPSQYDHGNGIAVADVDNDGLQDIYFVSQIGGNKLWKNTGNGKFIDITKSAGVGLEDQVKISASFADIDNDGLEDLYVATIKGGNRLFANLGNGHFQDITKEAGLEYFGHSSAAMFFDYNLDGLLDLLLVNVGQFTKDKSASAGYPPPLSDAFNGYLYPERSENIRVYKNQGNRKFQDVTQTTHLDNIPSWSGDATFADFNNDLYPDIYLLNMHGDNHYFENQQGRYFIDKTQQYFPKTPPGAMGIKFFDFDNDGNFDLFTTDMHSDMSYTPNWNEEKIKSRMPLAVDGTRRKNSIFGNSFYKNLAKGQFKEISDEIGVETLWPWGVSVDDLNADGFDDIFISSGMGYPFRYGINSLLLNMSGRKFIDSEFILGVEPRKMLMAKLFDLDCRSKDKIKKECDGKNNIFQIFATVSSRSSVIFDIDNDGDLDIITNEHNAPPQILVSNLSQMKKINYLKIKLVGSRSNQDGLGAKVTIYTNRGSQTKYFDGKSGYLSQSIIPLFFGLGEDNKVNKIEILWPNGWKQIIVDRIPLNQVLTVTESSSF